LHTVGQGAEEGHRGLALDTLRVAGQRQHGEQPTVGHRQHKSSAYVSKRYLCVFIYLPFLDTIVPPPLFVRFFIHNYFFNFRSLLLMLLSTSFYPLLVALLVITVSYRRL